MNIYFTDYFGVSEKALEGYGAFNISLVTDLPLFIDPFLLFNSDNPEYRALHEGIIEYLRFLRTKSEGGGITPALMKAWYCFGEVKQNWLGFCETANSGRGLGREFARALDENLVHIFRDFGSEQITRGSHLEKLTLIGSGVGRDMISDFTTNLIKDYLLDYTSRFARDNISNNHVRPTSVSRAYFSYETERWMPRTYNLPVYEGDFVILTPNDILTKDDAWINYPDMVHNFERIPNAIDDDQLRAEINNYFYSMIPRDRERTRADICAAVSSTLNKYPRLVDYYIKLKEETGDQAVASSNLKVRESSFLYTKQFGELANLLRRESNFYRIIGHTESETEEKIHFFKDVIENKGGYRLFYGADGEPVRRERDVHILFRLVWHGTQSDVSTEVNDGRGPVDFKISRGASDKTLVEFKLATNPALKRNLEKQLDIYKKASDVKVGFKVIIYFSEEELARVNTILHDLGSGACARVVLIDARPDNKPSASKA